MAWAYWACSTFASSWAYGPNCCYFPSSWCVGPYFFLSFLSGFYNPLFFLLLTNLFLHPFLLVTGIFYCWAPFIKSGDQQPLRRKHSIVQSYLNSSIIIVDYVKSNDNLADPFIKALAKDRV